MPGVELNWKLELTKAVEKEDEPQRLGIINPLIPHSCAKADAGMLTGVDKNGEGVQLKGLYSNAPKYKLELFWNTMKLMVSEQICEAVVVDMISSKEDTFELIPLVCISKGVNFPSTPPTEVVASSIPLMK